MTDMDVGISLRDHFAGHALAGILANQELLCLLGPVVVGTHQRMRRAAAFAYEVANAMLKAREDGQS